MDSKILHLPELVNDPKWEGHVVEIDGAKLLVLTIHHPRHGATHHLLPRASADALREWLTRAATAPPA